MQLFLHGQIYNITNKLHTHRVVRANICALALGKIGCIGCCKKAEFPGLHKSGLHVNESHRDTVIEYVSGLFILTEYLL